MFSHVLPSLTETTLTFFSYARTVQVVTAARVRLATQLTQTIALPVWTSTSVVKATGVALRFA